MGREPFVVPDGAPVPGETVVVEQIRGLTLAVRRHEPWEVDLL